MDNVASSGYISGQKDKTVRNVKLSEAKDRLSELVSAVEAGEEVTITKHGRPVARLVAIEEDRMAKQQQAVRQLYALGQEILRTSGPTTAAEISQWINEDRR